MVTGLEERSSEFERTRDSFLEKLGVGGALGVLRSASHISAESKPELRSLRRMPWKRSPLHSESDGTAAEGTRVSSAAAAGCEGRSGYSKIASLDPSYALGGIVGDPRYGGGENSG